MADNLNVFPVYCEGGLNTNRDLLSQGETAPGSALRLINYEPSIAGGYRKINGYSNDFPSLPGTEKVLGVGVVDLIDSGIFAARAPDSGTDYLYSWNATTDTWDTITTPDTIGMTGVDRVRFIKYNWFAPRFLVVDGVNPAAYYDGTSYVQLTEAIDLPNAVYNNTSFSVASQEVAPTGMVFADRGSKVYVVGTDTGTVYHYALSTAYDISTASYTADSFDVSSQEATPQSVAFSADGLKMYVMGDASDSIHEYDFADPWDISTASYSSVTLDVSGQETEPNEFVFNDDGTKIFVIGSANDTVYEYDLSVAYDLSTASYNATTFDASTQVTDATGLTFNKAGTEMFIVSSNDDTVYQYDLSTAFDVSSATFSGNIFDVSNEEATPQAIMFNGADSKMYILGTTSDAIFQYTVTGIPDDPTIATEFQSHMFLAGDSDEPTQLYFSAPLDETDFSIANGGGSINVGFPITQIKKFRNELFIFGTSNIKKLIGSSVADFALQEVTEDLGCVAPDSLIEIGGDLLFLGPDGLRPVSGTDRIGDIELETVSKPIQELINNILTNQNLVQLCSVVIRQKSQFRYMFSSSEDSGILGGLQQGSSGGIGFEFSQLLGIPATCADSGYIGRTEYVIHGDGQGKVHRQEQGYDFDESEIFSLFQTPYLYMGDPELRKNFLKITSYLKVEGASNIALGVTYDYEDALVASPNDFILSTEGAASFYNEAVFDNAGVIYDGNPSPVLRTNVSGSGTSISLRYVTADTLPSHSVQGFVFLYGVGDRR